jgi:hypothetical protein
MRWAGGGVRSWWAGWAGRSRMALSGAAGQLWRLKTCCPIAIYGKPHRCRQRRPGSPTHLGGRITCARTPHRSGRYVGMRPTDLGGAAVRPTDLGYPARQPHRCGRPSPQPHRSGRRPAAGGEAPLIWDVRRPAPLIWDIFACSPTDVDLSLDENIARSCSCAAARPPDRPPLPRIDSDARGRARSGGRQNCRVARH